MESDKSLEPHNERVLIKIGDGIFWGRWVKVQPWGFVFCRRLLKVQAIIMNKAFLFRWNELPSKSITLKKMLTVFRRTGGKPEFLAKYQLVIIPELHKTTVHSTLSFISVPSNTITSCGPGGRGLGGGCNSRSVPNVLSFFHEFGLFQDFPFCHLKSLMRWKWVVG